MVPVNKRITYCTNYSKTAREGVLIALIDSTEPQDNGTSLQLTKAAVENSETKELETLDLRQYKITFLD